MDSICVKNVLPEVFVSRTDIESEVWRREVTFSRGNVYLVSADSGTGKSSLCSFIYGVRRDYSGDILFDGENIRNMSLSRWCDIRSRAISYLPQDLCLFPELTAAENIFMKLRLTRYKTEAEVKRYFEILGIADKYDSLVGRMSIGQQQRVAIIRTLCQPCDFFLMDEPVSHLDARNNDIAAHLIADEVKRSGAGLIFTSVGNNLNIEQQEVLKL